MTQRTFLDFQGLQRFLNNLKAIIPTKTSDLTNDSGFLIQHNPVDSSLSNTSENAVQNKVVKDALDGKSDTGHTHSASEVSGLSTVATSGSYNDLSNTPTIPTVNNAKLTIQRNGTTVKTFTANASSNVTANITVPTAVSELTNDSGYLTSASSLDSSKLTGTIDIARLPKGALERLVTVANQTARFALTTSDVQLGDTVKQLDTGVMYIVTDESKLNSADGYTEYTAGSATSVPWSGVTGKPSSFTPSSHTHGNVTNDGKLPTASRALISDSSKNITVSSVTDTELGFLSGVTSSVQTQLNGKAASSHTHTKSEITDFPTLATVATSGSYSDLSNKPTIDSALSSTSTNAVQNKVINSALTGKSDTGHTHVGADVTDLATVATSGKYTDLTSIPSSFTPASHTHGSITNDGKLGTASRALVTDSSKKIAVSSVTSTELGYLSGVTSAIQTQLNGKSASTHVHGNITNDGKVGTTANKPLITGTGGAVQTGSFGNAANTFCEGNDSRLSDARTPVSHTHTKSDVTDLLNSDFIPSSDVNYTLGSSDLRWKYIWCSAYKTKSGNIDFTDSTTTGSSQSWWIDTMEKNGTGFFGVGSIRTHSLGLNEEHFRIKNAGGKWADLYIQLGDNNQFTVGTSSHSDVTNNGFRGKFTPLDSFIPNANNSYDLGSSSYQWNNLYAKNYFYNGTQWGLDQANTWTAQNSFNSDLNLNYASSDVDDIVNSVAGSATLDNFVHMTGNESVSGIKSFPDGIVANVTGSATSATNDGSGNVISTTYGKLGANNVWTGRQTYTDYAILYKSSKLPATKGQLPSENINPLRQYIGYETGYDNSYFIHDTQINADGMLFYRWTVFNIDHSDNAAMFLQIDPASQDLTKKLVTRASVLPQQTNVYSLGKSDLQWKNVYSRAYYYNGTQWGLDQANVWSQNQTISNNSAALILKNPEMTLGVTPASSVSSTLSFHDVNNVSIGYIQLKDHNNSNNVLSLIVKNKNGTDTYDCALRFRVTKYGTAMLYPEDASCDLGSASFPFKTLNGVNPGELSLPNMGTSASQTIDITDWYIPDPDDPTYPDENAKKIDDSVEHTIEGSSHAGAGYIQITIPNVSGNYAYARQYAMGTNMSNVIIADGLAFSAFPNISFIFPIVNALKIRIKAKTATVRFFPCIGNV